MSNGTVNTSIQVIDRAAHLLDAIAKTDGTASLKILSAETGLHPSTAHRILAALSAHGLVERDEAGQYRLGIALYGLASRVQKRIDLRKEALPIMEQLRSQIGETVNLTVREGDEVVYVERASSHKAIRVEQVIGSRAPLHVTAVGKLFLAHDGQEACLAYAQRSGLPAYTPNTLADPSRLWEEATHALRQGHALDNEEAEPGVGCIAVPVVDAGGKMVAGLSISAPIQRRKSEWIPLMIEAGTRLSSRLGARAE
ncbi:MAG: IclR family transcriptional regulator [Gammaproteobacteria bacterium]|nr:IclR family transcriptional regulator [Gammaproteobacteria bacterium]